MDSHSALINWFQVRHPEWKLEGDNTPLQQQSIDSLRQLHHDIVSPLEQAFGNVHITYGFTSPELLRRIKKDSPGHIAPELDQHASFELNLRGNRICKRDGAACDITLSGYENQMQRIAHYIVDNLKFDRLYFYGDSRPIHISVGPENNRFVQIMNTSADNKRSMGKHSYGDDALELFNQQS